MLPIIPLLLSQALPAVANAALVKGSEWVKDKTGIDLSQSLDQAKIDQLKNFETNAEIKQLMVEDNRIQAELEKARLEAETAQRQAIETTAQAEAVSTDEYVRRTRPRMARYSFYFGTLYSAITGIGFPLTNQFYGAALPDMDGLILSALYSPALTFMGVRSFEAFSKQGKK